jgi:hypothetical protein
VPLLAAEATDLSDGHALQPMLGEGVLHILQLEVPDDGLDLFHQLAPRDRLLRHAERFGRWTKTLRLLV